MASCLQNGAINVVESQSLNSSANILEIAETEVGLNGININLLVVYRESVNLIGYITRRLSADSLQLHVSSQWKSAILNT